MGIVNELQAEWDRALLGTPRDQERSTRQAAELDLALASGEYRSPTGPVPLRPVLLPSAKVHELTSMSRRLLRLIESICTERAKTPTELAELLGYRRPPASMLTDDPKWNATALDMARPDIIISGGIPRFVEYNITSGIAGPEQMTRQNRFFMNKLKAMRRDIAAKFVVPDTFTARREVVMKAARAYDISNPRVCLLGWSDEGLGSRDYFSETIDDFNGQGISCGFAIPDQLDSSPTALTHRGQRIDIAYRTFAYTHEGAKQVKWDIGPLRHAMEAGTAVTLAPELADLYSSKKILAWLSESADSLPTADRVFVETHIPWTRVVADLNVSWRGRSLDLLSLLTSEQDRFILKPHDQLGGRGVVVGQATTAAEWHDAVTSAATHGGYVVQEFWSPDPIEIPVHRPSTGSTELVRAASVVSPILFGGNLGGLLVRHTDSPATSIVNIATGVDNTAWYA
ncbi:hypothetical protein IU483_28410 [Streptomyces gardneri]|nr:hypothetical protein [Streptomyces gardneri]